MSDRITHTRGRQRDILGYMFAYPNKHITIAELEKHFKGKYDRNQIMATMAHVCNPDIQARYGMPVKRITTGVWSIVMPANGQAVLEDEAPKKGETAHRRENVMYVEILKERETHLIVEDVDDGKIYKMTLVG